MKRILTSVVIFQILLSTSNAIDNFRYISSKDLHGVNKFQSNNVTQLLFDVEREQVIVGARDNLYRLRLKSLDLLEEVLWQVTKNEAENCQNIGGLADDCHNYIKVLLRNETEVLACGTFASNPLCTWRKIDNMNEVVEVFSGKGKYPSWPYQTLTSLLVNDELFIGSEIREGGIIFKNFATPEIHSATHDSRMLYEPRFVGTFETETHVYFLFREYATEWMSDINKIVYSRIARVCKTDPGVKGVELVKWTTFMKARLSCRIPGDVPFYYDQIQSVVYHSEKKIFYAVFSTPMNGVPGSAVCAFDLEGVEESFDGLFQYQENSKMKFERKEFQNHPGRMCNSYTSHDQTSQQYLLMNRDVKSTTLRPIFLAEERFTEIAADVTPNEVHDHITVLYVATKTGFIKKISVSSKTQESCVIEVWGPLPSRILTLKFVKHTDSLFVGTETSLVSIPAIQCHRYINRQECLNAQDPYCGWDETIAQCTQMPESQNSLKHWHQKLDKCLSITDSGAGEWSPKSPRQLGNTDESNNAQNTNQCETKKSNDSLSTVRAANCTTHDISSRIVHTADISVIPMVVSLILGFILGIIFTVFLIWFDLERSKLLVRIMKKKYDARFKRENPNEIGDIET